MIEILLSVGLVGGAAGTGNYLLQALGTRRADRAEAIVFSIALGFGCLILVVLALGLVGLLYRQAIWVLVGIWGAIGWRKLWPQLTAYPAGLRSPSPLLRAPAVWLGGLGLLAMGLHLVRALAPPHGATDPLAYQLALPRIYLTRHLLSFEPTITGALYPSNMGILYVIAMALRDGTLAQVLHWLMGALVCFGIYACGRQSFGWQAGIWGASVFSFVPIVVVFATQGYVDVGLCFFQFAAVWAILSWDEEPDWRLLLLAALLAGLAMGVKHQGLATALVGAIVIVRRRLWCDRSPRGAAGDLALYLGPALLLVAPWYLRAYVLAGNPVWPLANGLFNGAPFGSQPVVTSGGGGPGSDGAWWQGVIPTAAWFRVYGDSMNPWRWTFAPDGWQKAIGVYFAALLPGLLLYARQRRHLHLLGFCALYYVLLVRLLHMNPRYGLVLFAFASVLCGVVAQRLASSPSRVVRTTFAVAALATATFNLSWAYALARPYLPVAFGMEAREVFLQRVEPTYRLFRFVNESTPASSRILLQGIVRGYYCERPYLWDHPHQAVLRYEDFPNPEDLYHRMRELGVSHVARMIDIPPGRLALGYPQYFADEFHERFREKYLRPLYRDESFVLFILDDHQAAGKG